MPPGCDASGSARTPFACSITRRVSSAVCSWIALEQELGRVGRVAVRGSDQRERALAEVDGAGAVLAVVQPRRDRVEEVGERQRGAAVPEDVHLVDAVLRIDCPSNPSSHPRSSPARTSLGATILIVSGVTCPLRLQNRVRLQRGKAGDLRRGQPLRPRD